MFESSLIAELIIQRDDPINCLFWEPRWWRVRVFNGFYVSGIHCLWISFPSIWLLIRKDHNVRNLDGFEYNYPSPPLLIRGVKILVLLWLLLKFTQTSWQNTKLCTYNRFLEGSAQINEGQKQFEIARIWKLTQYLPVGSLLFQESLSLWKWNHSNFGHTSFQSLDVSHFLLIQGNTGMVLLKKVCNLL